MAGAVRQLGAVPEAAPRPLAARCRAQEWPFLSPCAVPSHRTTWPCTPSTSSPPSHAPCTTPCSRGPTRCGRCAPCRCALRLLPRGGSMRGGGDAVVLCDPRVRCAHFAKQAEQSPLLPAGPPSAPDLRVDCYPQPAHEGGHGALGAGHGSVGGGAARARAATLPAGSGQPY